MSHASYEPLGGTGSNFGIGMRRGAGGPENDGTLAPAEISGLSRLPWADGGFLVLCGCHTGDPNPKSGEIVADFFARQQGVMTIGQRGSASFSRTWDLFLAHDGADTSETVYLWSYARGGNSPLTLGVGRRNKGYVARIHA